MRPILLFTFLLALWTACADPNPKVVYNESTDTTDNNILGDTTAITVAGLPIHFDSTNFLIHPIGPYKAERRRTKIYSSSYSSGARGLAIAYKSGYSVSGNLDNLKFQHIDSSVFVPLTDKQIQIRSFTFLRAIFKSSKRQVLVYSVTDKDTNKDEKLDDADIESLYISNIAGHNFKKLSPDTQELVDWKVIAIQNRIYFTTLEDIDKNGEFDKSDKLHYYYVNLLSDNREAIEYDPMKK